MGILGSLFGSKKYKTAMDYAYKVSGFAPYLSMSELSKIHEEGQSVARRMDDAAFKKPLSGYAYAFPHSAVGEFNALIRIMEDKGDEKRAEEALKAARAFDREYGDQIEHISLFLHVL